MHIRNQIEDIIRKALKKVKDEISYSGLDIGLENIVLERPKNTDHGDLSCNIAMQLVKSKSCKNIAPRQVAEVIVRSILTQDSKLLNKAEVAGAGFVNLYFKKEVWLDELHRIHLLREKYGASNTGKGKKVHIEYVSANPTGPLHVGHGRGAVVGDVMANIYEKAGFKIIREYYINDLGTQISILGKSIKAYIDHLEQNIPYKPEADWYQGDYIKDLAKNIIAKHGSSLSSEENGKIAAQILLDESIKKDLDLFGLKEFDIYFSEKQLHDNGSVKGVFDKLREKDLLLKKDGAVWFRSSNFGDEKDRVVIRDNGQPTYLASDMAYHWQKCKGKYDEIIDIWGADHHGYINRVKASIEALGFDTSCFKVMLIQMVNLLRNGEPVKMSKRSGDYVTLLEVLEEVGKDAARFTFLTRRTDSHLDFDLELVKKRSMDNPVYYLQYAFARTCNIFEYAQSQGLKYNETPSDLGYLNSDEVSLIKIMSYYEETILVCLDNHEPYYLVDYLIDLAKEFHSYYNKHRVITDDKNISKARLYVIGALNILLKDAFKNLGIEAPRKM